MNNLTLPMKVPSILGMKTSLLEKYRVAVLIPCFNEELVISHVVSDFRLYLPDADIYVYDNNSSDRSVQTASDAGALVRNEVRQGKGNVVRRMFADIDADIYIMVDGDDTYDASIASELVEKILSGPYDLVNCARIAESKAAFRFGHSFGNRLLTKLVRMFFGADTHDMLSGYKAFSRRYVKSFPVLSSGFEIETEIMIHALELKMPIAEIYAPYSERREGSESKLRTYRDGFRILWLIGFLLKEERPFSFFSAIACMLAIASIVLGMPVVIHFFETGFVPRLPTALLAVGIMMASILAFMCGLILDSTSRNRREIKRLFYLSQPLSM